MKTKIGGFYMEIYCPLNSCEYWKRGCGRGYGEVDPESVDFGEPGETILTGDAISIDFYCDHFRAKEG